MHYISRCFINKFTSATVLLCLTVLLFSSCQKTPSPTTAEGFYFDTFVTITIYDPCDSSVPDGCLALCSYYDTLLSKTIPDSDIYRINHADGAPVSVSSDTILLLAEAVSYAKLTDGRIDPTIETVNSLWDFHQISENSVPAPEDIATALPHVNYQNITISEDTVQLKDPEAVIDLGFLAKGFIADRLTDYLLSHGIRNAIINLGGNTVVFGSKGNDDPFLVGVETPFENGVPIAVFALTDCSLVTSGIYHRYFYEGDTLYHHILDAKTGYPINNGLYSVSILGESSLTCDALSTTCFVLGPDKGMELIESLEDYEAMFILDDYSIRYSSGFPNPQP